MKIKQFFNQIKIKSNQVYLVTAKYQINDKTTVTRAS